MSLKDELLEGSQEGVEKVIQSDKNSLVSELAGEGNAAEKTQRPMSATFELDHYLNGDAKKPELLVLSEEEKEEITQKGKEYANEYSQAMLLAAAREKGIDVENPEELAKYEVRVVNKNVDGDIFSDMNKPTNADINKAEMKENITPDVKVPTEVRESSVTTFTKNRQFVENKNDSKLMERLKNRKRKGSGTSGMLYNTNLKVVTYSMDKPLKLKALADGLRYASATTFHSEKMLIELYEHTSVLCKGGDRLSSESFYDGLSLEDLNDYLMLGLIGSNKNGILKNLPLHCTIDGSENFKNKDEICGTKYYGDVDLVRMQEESITDDMRNFANQYSHFDTFAQCLAKGTSATEEWIEFHNPDMDEVMIMSIKSPNVSRYFEIKRKIMEFVYRSLCDNTSLMNIAVGTDQHFKLKSLDDKLLILSELDENAYIEIVERMNNLLYMDSIYILPTDVYNQMYRGEQSTVSETSKYLGKALTDLKDGEDGVSIIPPKSEAEIYHTIMMEMSMKDLEVLQDRISKLSNRFDRPRYKFVSECPTCGNRKTMFVSVIELFFIFLRLKSTMDENQ